MSDCNPVYIPVNQIRAELKPYGKVPLTSTNIPFSVNLMLIKWKFFVWCSKTKILNDLF